MYQWWTQVSIKRLAFCEGQFYLCPVPIILLLDQLFCCIVSFGYFYWISYGLGWHHTAGRVSYLLFCEETENSRLYISTYWMMPIFSHKALFIPLMIPLFSHKTSSTSIVVAVLKREIQFTEHIISKVFGKFSHDTFLV
jgi:hypothetical protein